MTEKLDYKDIEVDKVWVSEEYSVTREEVIEYASRWDPQPFHLDDAAAEKWIFKKLTASASHTFAILGYLASTLDQIDLLAVLGMEKLEIIHPVFPGDRLNLQRRILSKRRSRTRPDRGIVEVEYRLNNQNGKIVMEAHNKLMVGCGEYGSDR